MQDVQPTNPPSEAFDVIPDDVRRDAKRLLRRKNIMGRACTYRDIASAIGRSKPTVHTVLTNRPSRFPIDRRAILEAAEPIIAQKEAEVDHE